MVLVVVRSVVGWVVVYPEVAKVSELPRVLSSQPWVVEIDQAESSVECLCRYVQDGEGLVDKSNPHAESVNHLEQYYLRVLLLVDVPNHVRPSISQKFD